MSSPTLGTLINGTLRTCDLMPAFLDELERLDPNGYAGYLDGLEADNYNLDVLLGEEHIATDDSRSNGPSMGLDEDHEFWDSEDAAEIVAELVHLIGQHAPNGCYFGPAIGSLSDFGFWKIED